MYLRIFGAFCALIGVFLLGMWLTWPDLPYNPSGFPIGRRFVAVSLNGEPLMFSDTPRAATLEVRGRFTFKHRAGGASLCSTWGLPVTLLPGRRIKWRGGPRFQVAVNFCASPAMKELDGKFLRALLTALRWRTEEGNLILENGRDILRFQLAPLGMPD
jgi:heat shock protein HslJ